MPLGANIQAWRLSRKQSLERVASIANLAPSCLQAIESGEQDPSASSLEAVATALNIPTSWLYVHPKHLELLMTDTDGETLAAPSHDSVDPVLEHVLQGMHRERELYVLLTVILQSSDPKLLMAAEASLRSLAKQAKRSTIPWQSRQPGHFEPPSD